MIAHTMEQYQISINLKTHEGVETFGNFFLGNDFHFAESTFDLLQGNDDVSDQSVISIDLTRQTDGIALPVRILHCTLDQLATNTKIITKEIFKELNLELR